MNVHEPPPSFHCFPPRFLPFNDGSVYDLLIIILLRIHLTLSFHIPVTFTSVFLSEEQMHHKKNIIKRKYLCDSTFCLVVFHVKSMYLNDNVLRLL